MFEFGDYVKIDLKRAAGDKPLGLNETNNIGRIIGHDIESHEFCVEFLEDVHGHDGNGFLCLGAYGHCWWFPYRYIIKTDHKTMSFLSNLSMQIFMLKTKDFIIPKQKKK